MHSLRRFISVRGSRRLRCEFTPAEAGVSIDFDDLSDDGRLSLSRSRLRYLFSAQYTECP